MAQKQLNELTSYPIKLISLSELEEDPLNKDAFSSSDIEQLAEDIRRDGFFGEIAAYPIENGRYRIESGHRRYQAALLAGLPAVPVSITHPPRSMVERRLRLTQWNLHGRNYTPIDVARLVSFTYDTFLMMKKQGLADGSLLELTAKELDISVSHVSKYKMLLSLIPQLQELVETGKYSWAIMAQASQLREENQRQLYINIINEGKIHPITGKWLAKEIEEYKHLKLFDTGRTAQYENYKKIFSQRENEEENKKNKQNKRETQGEKKLAERKKPRHRRKDGGKGIRRAYQIIQESLREDALIKEKDKEEVYALLMDIRHMINQSLEEW